MLQTARRLADQVYDAIVADICDGRLAAGAHLVQERLAERFGVSRQPIQQAMNRLKADGVVEESGRRGLFVARLDPDRMLDHYGVRAALDGWAAKTAARRAAADPALLDRTARRSREIFAAARRATDRGEVAALVGLDDEFHALIYEASGNRLIAESAAPHWRFLRRAMGDVLRRATAPAEIWAQHRRIMDLILAGEAGQARDAAEDHAASAARLLAGALAGGEKETSQ